MIGCLWIPDLPLQALLRVEPSLHGQAVAVATGEGARAQVVGVSTRARTQGVAQGQRLQQARALCPELVVRWQEEDVLQAARDAALDAAASVSPRIEEARPGLVWIDASGLGKLHGGEREVAAALLRAAEQVGLEGRASLAIGKRVAEIAALRGEGIEVVAKGQERAFLAPLPLRALGAGDALLETLGRWGIATAGDLATLPGPGVASRLGQEGERLHRLARGEDREPLVPIQHEEVFEEGCDLDHELIALEGLLFLLRPVIERLLGRLSCRGLSCGGLVLRLALGGGGEAVLPVEVAAPTKDLGTLLALCRSMLERRPPGGAIRGVRVRAHARGGRVEQLRLFGLPSISPDELATAVAKVAAIVGEGRLGAPRLQDSHLPDAIRLERFDPPPPPSGEASFVRGLESADVSWKVAEEGATWGGARALGLLRFRPPVQAEVRMAGGAPQSLRAGGVAGWVVSCAGPWRVDVGWHDAPAQQDGFDVELSDGAVYRLTHDRLQDRWLLLGRYD